MLWPKVVAWVKSLINIIYVLFVFSKIWGNVLLAFEDFISKNDEVPRPFLHHTSVNKDNEPRLKLGRL